MPGLGWILNKTSKSNPFGELKVVDVVVFIVFTMTNLLARNIPIDECCSHQMMYVEFLSFTFVVQSNPKQSIAIGSRIQKSVESQTLDLTEITHRVIRKPIDLSPLLFDHSLISFLILLELYSVEFIET